MSRNLAILASLASLGLAGCTTGGSFQARVVDGFTGKPVPELRLLLKAKTDGVPMTCLTFEGSTDADGNVTVTGLCGGATYAVESTDKTLFLQDSPQVEGGVKATAPLQLTGWRAPESDGLYLLADDQLSGVRTGSDVSSVKVWETEVTVRYPNEIPAEVTRVEGDTKLLISGKTMIDRMQPVPLVPHDQKRRFGNPDGYTDMEPWSYIGFSFTSDTEYQQVTATFDPAKVKDVSDATHSLRYVQADALPPGRYVLGGPDDRRVYILDFGPSGS